ERERELITLDSLPLFFPLLFFQYSFLLRNIKAAYTRISNIIIRASVHTRDIISFSEDKNKYKVRFFTDGSIFVPRHLFQSIIHIHSLQKFQYPVKREFLIVFIKFVFTPSFFCPSLEKVPDRNWGIEIFTGR
ncbi:hypothetical protein, partial [Dysgonomonas gadei]